MSTTETSYEPSSSPQPQSFDTTPAANNQPQDNRHATMIDGSPVPEKLHPMVVLQKGEQVVAILKRHPIGIISMYVSGMIALLLLASIAIFLLPNISNQYNITNLNSLVYGGIGALTVIMLLILWVATIIYWQNQWIITTDSITQITQTSLFDRQVAQLSMDNLEDVTVDQNGILPHIFGYGSLKVETAGERSKFLFQYCPNPNKYARQVLEIHETFLEDRRNIQNRP